MKPRNAFYLTGIFLVLLVGSFRPASTFAALAAESRKDDSFSVKGLVTRIDSATKTLYVKTEGGLELTYHVDDSTQVEAPGDSGGTPDRELLFSKLAVNDSVEISYRYNENYEKMALSVRKQQEKSKTPRP